MLVGHQKQWRFLKKSAEQNRLSHAYLFTGQEKLGKKTLALEFLKLFFGSDNLSSHPDFILIEPKEKDYNPPTTRGVLREGRGRVATSSFARASIQIEQIRDLNRRISLKPFLASFKAAIIDQAHLMNQEAQNCFLKTLEEPKGKTILILISEYPEVIFPTIRSRTEIIKFYPVPKKEIENYLKEQGVEEKKVKIISQISQGKPGKAIDFFYQPQKLKEREELIDEIIRLTKSDLTFRFQYVQKISQSPQLKEILNVWLSYFREILITQLQKCASPDLAHSVAKLINIIKQIQTANFLISTTNVNPRLTLETLMLEF